MIFQQNSAASGDRRKFIPRCTPSVRNGVQRKRFSCSEARSAALIGQDQGNCTTVGQMLYAARARCLSAIVLRIEIAPRLKSY